MADSAAGPEKALTRLTARRMRTSTSTRRRAR